jgi:hypothetical protein
MNNIYIVLIFLYQFIRNIYCQNLQFSYNIVYVNDVLLEVKDQNGKSYGNEKNNKFQIFPSNEKYILIHINDTLNGSRSWFAINLKIYINGILIVPSPETRKVFWNNTVPKFNESKKFFAEDSDYNKMEYYFKFYPISIDNFLENGKILDDYYKLKDFYYFMENEENEYIMNLISITEKLSKYDNQPIIEECVYFYIKIESIDPSFSIQEKQSSDTFFAQKLTIDYNEIENSESSFYKLILNTYITIINVDRYKDKQISNKAKIEI